MLIYTKRLAPKAGDRELARVVHTTTGHSLHNETVKALLKRYFFWQYPEFREAVRCPIPTEPEQQRLEMRRLKEQGWSEKHIAALLRCSPKTVNKWLRRLRQTEANLTLTLKSPSLWYQDQSRAPHQPARKVFFGAIHAVLELQKKYGYAGWFRIKGYLEKDYGIYLGSTAIKKIMALNRRIHLAPQRPVTVVEGRDPREGPPKSWLLHGLTACMLHRSSFRKRRHPASLQGRSSGWRKLPLLRLRVRQGLQVDYRGRIA